MTPEQIARSFYDAFAALDVDTLATFYADDVHFRDPIFSFDNKQATVKMWRKLLRKGRVQITYWYQKTEGQTAVGTWEARYEVVRGRPVHNVIESRLSVDNDKIIEHRDNFPFAVWAAQAFPVGILAKVPPIQWGIKALVRARIS